MQTAIKMTTTTYLSYPALGGPLQLRVQAQAPHGGELLESWKARMAVRDPKRMISYLDSAAAVAVVVVKFPGLEGVVVQMARRRCRRWLRVWMAKVRVAGSKVMIGAIGGVGEMVEDVAVEQAVVEDTTAVGGRGDLEAGVAHDGMGQVEWAVEVGAIDLLFVGLGLLSLLGIRTLRLL